MSQKLQDQGIVKLVISLTLVTLFLAFAFEPVPARRMDSPGIVAFLMGSFAASIFLYFNSAADLAQSKGYRRSISLLAVTGPCFWIWLYFARPSE